MRAGRDQPVGVLPPARRGDGAEPGADAADRRAVPGDTLVRLAADGAASAARGLWRGSQAVNTDQGGQFTSPRFTGVLQRAGARVSMDGRGRWLDNVFIERLWRSLKYECVYLHAFETGSELRAGLANWIGLLQCRTPT
jgi:transposase InsO family protein